MYVKILDKFNFRLFSIFSGIILFWIIVGGYFTINNSFQLIGLGFGILGFYKPKYALYLMLFFLPLFGERPSGVQVHYLIVYSSYILLGIYINIIVNKYKLKKFISRVRLNNIILLFTYLFFIISFLSLIGLPILGMIKKTLEEDSFYIFKNILSVGETTLFSSVQSVFLLFQAFLFGLYIYGISNKNKYVFYKYIILAILSGLLFSIVVGHLDFFGLYDLSWYRNIDGVSINRFHSFFVNSSWYSQYLAILLPLIPIILLFIKNTKIAIFTLIFLIVLGEVTLILSMQRGAWITYPPTLLLIWVSLYYVLDKIKDTSINLNQFLKKSWFKIIITIPLTVTMSVYIVYGIKDYRKTNNIKSATNTFLDVTERANKVAISNDRLQHWPPAIKLAKENPIFGGGGDSFGWQYKIYYQKKNGKFNGDTTDTLSAGGFGTTHNLYLQTLTGKGIFGLIFLLGFIFTLIYMLIKKEFLSIKNRSIEESVISLVILGSLLATVIYANVQEIFYIQSVSIIFWVIFFMGLAIVFEHSNKKVRTKLNKIFSYIVYLILVLLPFHVFNISYVKDFISSKVAFLSGNFLDTIIWIVLAVLIYTIYMQRKVIEYSHISDFLIDCDKSDKPQMSHDTPTPRAGGIGIFFGNLFLISNPLGWKLIIVALPAFIAGLIDDFNSISPKARLLMQTVSAILVVFLFDTYIISIGFGINLNFYLASILTIIAIVGVINSINIIDGFNGLTGGFSLMVLISFAIISWFTQDMILLEIIIVTIVTVFSFMLFNYPKGKIFLGDGGAYFLGTFLAMISLTFVNRHSEVSQWYPLAILIYPIFEIVFSMYRRKIISNKKMTQHDRLHLHQLIYYRITRDNPSTSKFIWIRILPFIIFATIFYENDLALILNIIVFIIYYIYLYKNIVTFRYNSKNK